MGAEELVAVVRFLRSSGISSTIVVRGFCQGGLVALGAASVASVGIQAVVGGLVAGG
jgi:dienelactone hydrolase